MRLAGQVVSTLTSPAGSWGSTPGGVMYRFCTTKVTFLKKQTLYAISKLLFEKTKRYMLYQSYCSKKTERYTLYQSYFSIKKKR